MKKFPKTQEKLLKKITSPYIVASFATRSLGGGKLISARRLKWFEQLVPGAEKFITVDGQRAPPLMPAKR